MSKYRERKFLHEEVGDVEVSEVREAVAGEPVADMEQGHGFERRGFALEEDGMVGNVYSSVDLALEGEDLQQGCGEIETGLSEDVGSL